MFNIYNKVQLTETGAATLQETGSYKEVPSWIKNREIGMVIASHFRLGKLYNILIKFPSETDGIVVAAEYLTNRISDAY